MPSARAECVLVQSSRTISLPREAKQPPTPEDQTLKLTTLTPHGCQGANLSLEMADSRRGCGRRRVDSPGIWGATSGQWSLRAPKAGVGWGGGGAGSWVAEAPGTFGERLENFVYWNFRSVEILRFDTTPSSAPRSPDRPVFLRRGSSHPLGWGWEASLVVLQWDIPYIKPEIPVSGRPPSRLGECGIEIPGIAAAPG